LASQQGHCVDVSGLVSEKPTCALSYDVFENEQRVMNKLWKKGRSLRPENNKTALVPLAAMWTKT
jgi:hypothetical protein